MRFLDGLLCCPALAAVIDNEHIASDLQAITDTQIPLNVPRSFAMDSLAWPFHEGESTAFDRLLFKVRRPTLLRMRQHHDPQRLLS
jgi:hypothetical protein